ncbi:hypothetical protein [Pacificispira sp.]|uniref:hypothetical protein n=1 Tax=Pacificispira sp. TaxID=2888761 RepID=UPI003B524E8C
MIISDERDKVAEFFAREEMDPPTFVWNPDPETFPHPLMKHFLATWQQMPHAPDRPIPLAKDFDVFAFRSAIGHMMYLDVIDGGRDFRYRVYGSRIAQFSGFDLTGKNLGKSGRAVDQPGFHAGLLQGAGPAAGTVVHATQVPARLSGRDMEPYSGAPCGRVGGDDATAGREHPQWQGTAEYRRPIRLHLNKRWHARGAGRKMTRLMRNEVANSNVALTHRVHKEGAGSAASPVELKRRGNWFTGIRPPGPARGSWRSKGISR